MTANRSMRSLSRAALGVIASAIAVPALADEPGSEARLAAALGRVAGYPLADAQLGTYRGAGLIDAFAAVIAAVPPGYTAVANINGATVGNPPGQTTPQSIPPTTIGGTTVTATAGSTATAPTSTVFTRSSTSTSTRTLSLSRSFSW